MSTYGGNMKTLNNKNINGYEKLVASILALGISISVCSGCENVDIKDKANFSITEVDSNDLYRKLVNSTDVSNLDAFELVKDFIIDYGKYMDEDKLVESSKDLEIIHKYLDMEQTGYYDRESNTIVINDRTSTDDSALFRGMASFLGGFGIDVLDLGIAQEIANEYYKRNPDIYSKEVAYTNALMEIVGKDAMIDAYLSNDLEMLISEMEKYTSRADSITLIECMNSAVSFYDSYKEDGRQEDYNNFLACNEVFWVIGANMFKNKYGTIMDKDSIMCAYRTITTGTNYTDKKGLDGVEVNKGYFDEQEDSIIYSTNSTGMGEVINGKYITGGKESVKIKKRS